MIDLETISNHSDVSDYSYNMQIMEIALGFLQISYISNLAQT